MTDQNSERFSWNSAAEETNPKPQSQKERNAEYHTATEQSPRLGSVRHTLQQAGLCRRRTFLVASLYPAQCAHRAGSRGTIQPYQVTSPFSAIRTRRDGRRWRLRDRPWSFLWIWSNGKLDRGRHSPHSRRDSGGTLGCHSGRSDRRAIEKQSANVR